MGYIAKAISRKTVRELAQLIRKIQCAENELYFPILEFMEKTLPSIIPNYTFRIGTLEEMGDCEGLTLPDRKEIVIREDVYNRAYEGGGRERLTIAHELFHFLMHSEKTVAFARTSGNSIPAYQDPEWQADAFGGELLVPFELARNLTIEQIAEKCGVSVKAATVQYRKMH